MPGARRLPSGRGGGPVVRAADGRRPSEEQEAIEEGYGDRLDALYAAMRQLFRIPAPDLAALATKIALAVDHEAGALNGGEACMAALKRDAFRLAAAA